MWEDLKQSFYQTFVYGDRYLIFLKGLWTTLTIAVLAVVIGIVLGMLIAVIRVYSGRTNKLKPLNVLCVVYVAIIRGTPIVVQLMILYFIVLVSIRNAVFVAVIGFGINSAAYVSEIIRAGIMSIDKGQTEAGKALGLPERTIMGSIILPQAIRNSVPPLFNEFITLFKETSVVGYIAGIDLTKAGDLVRSRTMQPFFSLIAIALIYLMIVLILTWIQSRLERKIWQHD